MSLGPQIVFEDKHFLVLDKPAGLVVDRSRTGTVDTLQDWLEEKFQSFAISRLVNCKTQGFYQRSGIVHRLDKETSGLLVAAKTPRVFASLQGQFRERKVEKKYLALVHGEVDLKEGTIRSPIARSPFDRKKFGVFLGGRESETKYKVIGILPDAGGGQLSLLELFPKTGRTHQIRVHLKHLGHPVVADDKYAGRKTARADRKWCPRQFLHAAGLSFTHPETGKRVKFFSPLSADLKKALKKASEMVK